MRKLAILFVLLFIMIIGPFFWSIYQKEDEINEEKTPNIEEEKIETEDNDRKIEIGIYKGKVDEQTIEIETDEGTDRKSTRLNSSHVSISYAVFCLKKKKINKTNI